MAGEKRAVVAKDESGVSGDKEVELVELLDKRVDVEESDLMGGTTGKAREGDAPSCCDEVEEASAETYRDVAVEDHTAGFRTYRRVRLESILSELTFSLGESSDVSNLVYAMQPPN